MTAGKPPKRRTAVRLDNHTLPRSGLVYAPVSVAQPYLRRLQIPWQYDTLRRALKIPKDRTDDLAAALEVDGYRVDVLMAGW